MQILLIALLIVLALCAIVAALMALMFAAVMGLAVGIPAYLILKNRPGINARFQRLTQNPLERLQTLYVEGKIDLFEFERRVARLIAIEH